jgi:hypothetical protein
MTMWPAADFRLSRAHRLTLILSLALLLSLGIASRATAQDAAVTPPPDAPTLSLTFNELNDSGVSGVATLYGSGEQTIVEIRVEDAGVNHPAHIHKGACDDLDPYPAFPLENVVDGRSTSLVDASLEELLTGGYAIDLHMSVNELGTLVVCTPITGEATDGTGATTPTTEATAEPTAEATETPEPEASATPAGVGGIGDASGDGTGGAQVAEDRASLPLSGIDDNGVTGIVSLTQLSDEQTDVIIQLSGDAITGSHIAHLHLGTCDDLADEGTIDLAEIDSSGLSQTTVDVPFTDLLEGGYAVNVHQSEEDYDTWLVCGEFSDATIGAVVPEVAPPTGGGSETPVPTVEPTVEPTPATNDLPATAGVGFGLPGADSPLSVTFWSIVIGGTILMFFAMVIRRGERTGRATNARWRRLGL